jgi:ABC-type transport system substrate-binding protein
LRVQLRAAVADADPANWPRAILDQVFEPLVWLAQDATPRPALAVAWQHDPDFRRWTFTLRSGVVFHDGAALNAAAVSEALTRLGEGRVAVPVGETVVVRCEGPAPKLLAELALPRNRIWRRAADGTLLGTGPFQVAQWEGGRQASLKANDRHWGGRPFLDSVVFEMGRSERERLVALELARAEVVELPPADFRRASQRGAATFVSPLLEVIALQVSDAKLRNVFAAAVDRAPMHSVLLGRQGEITAALLPQWLSGYSFLFRSARDLTHARQLALEIPKRAITVGFDGADTVARNIAERIAVDGREAGLAAQALPAAKTDARVVRLRVASSEPVVALRELGAAGEIPEPPYPAERDLMAAVHLLPLFHVPDLFALSRQVRAFSWQLADVWLEAHP